MPLSPLLLLARSSARAIADTLAFDAVAHGSSLNINCTFAHTCTGANRLLWVGVVSQSGDLVSGVTYNGVAMTLAKKQARGGSEEVYLYYLVNPASGANNVVVAITTNTRILAIASSYTGAKQSSQAEVTASFQQDTVGSATLGLTTLTDQDWVVGFDYTVLNVATAGTGCTIRDSFTSGSIFLAFGDTNGAVHPAGAKTFNFTAAADNHVGASAAMLASG